MTEQEVFKLWVETGCVPVEEVEKLYSGRFSTAEPFAVKIDTGGETPCNSR